MSVRPTKHFTRFIATLKIPTDRLGDCLSGIEGMSVPTRSGKEQKVWLPLHDSTIANQVKFLLPWVSRYLTGDVPRGSSRSDRDCVALHWNPEVRGRLRGHWSAESPQGSEGSRRRYEFTICDVETYIFSTGIVAVATECELLKCSGEDPNLDDVVNFNYDMQHLAGDRAPMVQLVPDKEGVPPAPFLPGSVAAPEGTTLLCVIQESLKPVFNDTHESLDPRTFRLLTYVGVPESTNSDQLGQLFYRLRRVAKESYEAAPADLAMEGRPDTVRTYANVFIGFSLEGMAMLAIDSSQPFAQERPNRFRCSYFAHYLLALHQRASLLSLALEAGNLPRITMACLGTGEIDQRIRELRLRAIDFNLHHRFAQVSTMTHYATVYSQMVDALAIPALVDEVRDEVAELDEVLAFYRDRDHVEQEDARRQAGESEAQRDRRLNQLIAVLGPLSLLLSLYGTNLPHYAQNPQYLSIPILLPLGVWAIVTSLLLWTLRNRPSAR